MNAGLRIQKGVERGKPIRFVFDGVTIDAFEGETVATALHAAGIRDFGRQGTRGIFCAMGLCQECVVRVAGGHVEACRLAATDGLAVERVS